MPNIGVATEAAYFNERRCDSGCLIVLEEISNDIDVQIYGSDMRPQYFVCALKTSKLFLLRFFAYMVFICSIIVIFICHYDEVDYKHLSYCEYNHCMDIQK